MKLTGKLPPFEIELDDKEKWMINEVDRNRVRKELLNKIKIDVDMVQKIVTKTGKFEANSLRIWSTK